MKPATILIVDDEADFTKLLKQFLVGHGFQCLEALSGRKAVEIFERNKDIIDIILLDWKMPDMDGDETLIRLKEIKPDVFVVMISAFGDQEKVTRSVNLGARGYIHKPISDNGTELLSKINDLLSLRHLADQEHLAQMGKLAANVAHYMKNALWNISGRVQMLMENESLFSEKDARESLQTIKRITEESNRVIYSLLHFSSSEPDKYVFQETPLASVVDEACNLIEAERKRKCIQLSVQQAEGAEILLRADKRKLVTAVHNVLQNALEAVDCNGQIRIDIHKTDERKKVLLRILDNGPGIPPEIRGKVFEPFFTTKPEAVGLGLYIASDIIKKHHGTIEIDSERKNGNGVAFIMTFMTAPNEDEAIPSERCA